MHLPIYLLALALWTTAPSGAVLASERVPKVKTFKCDAVFQRPGFATVEDFMEKVRAREDPWRDLLAPDASAEYDDPAALAGPLSKGLTVVHRSKEFAIVFAENTRFRRSPYADVVFLLWKTGRRFHVVDFIRRSIGYESYSVVAVPKVLKLEPRRFVHFYFVEYFGGRKCGFDTAELWLVGNHKFQRTLLLEDDGAFLSPAHPYREFDQTTEVSVSRGRPLMTVQRTWRMDEQDVQRQNFTVLFRWNARLEKFTSPHAGKIPLKEPDSWSGEGLPTPPRKRS